MYDKVGKIPDQHDGNKHDNSKDVWTNMTATNLTILTMFDQHDGNETTNKTATRKKAGPRWLALAQP